MPGLAEVPGLVRVVWGWCGWCGVGAGAKVGVGGAGWCGCLGCGAGAWVWRGLAEVPRLAWVLGRGVGAGAWRGCWGVAWVLGRGVGAGGVVRGCGAGVRAPGAGVRGCGCWGLAGVAWVPGWRGCLGGAGAWLGGGVPGMVWVPRLAGVPRVWRGCLGVVRVPGVWVRVLGVVRVPGLAGVPRVGGCGVGVPRGGSGAGGVVGVVGENNEVGQSVD